MRASILLLSLVGCGYLTADQLAEIQDVDQDGSIAVRFGGDDCRDDDPSIVHCDIDRDGHLGVAVGGTDCDDANPAVNPDAPEICNGIDDDCDGAVDAADDNVTSDQTWYADADGDGFGDANAPFACDLLDASGASVVTGGRRTRTSDDCDDTNPAVRPGGTEVCDDVDNDCNGEIDELGGLWFPDTDGDGAGAGTELTEGSCDVAPQAGLGLGNDDCAPDDASIYPGAYDPPYNGIPEDCVRDRAEWDVDGDGYVPEEFFAFAVAESDTFGLGLNYLSGDCDDDEFQANPSVAEVCDGFDNDCDGDVDAEDWFSASASGRAALEEDVLDDVYADADGDGYFGTLRWLCPSELDPSLYVQVADDCMDAPRDGFPEVDPEDVNRDADEVCDGIDNDCDGRIDNADAPFEGSSPRFLDDDGDGYGVLTVEACGVDPEEGIVLLGGDCDDSAADVNPGAVEICGDLVRQDCSGAGLFDCDGDGVEGEYPDGGSGADCLDEIAGTGFADSPEICDGLDNDCDGLIDTEDELSDEAVFPFWYVDADGDGYGVSAEDAGDDPTLQPVQVCDEPTGRVLQDGDCDDGNGEISPATIWYPDVDGDGFGAIEGGVLSCEAPGPDWALRGGDCADEDPRFHPDTIWLIDDDGDGLGAADPTPNEPDESDGTDGSQTFCVAPAGQNWVPQFRGVDCDDADLTVQGSSVFYQDLDGDGFGRDSAQIEACEVPDGYAVEYGDCNDIIASINPGAVETCSNADDDCDGLVNDEDPGLVAGAGGTPFYPDEDGDGFGDNMAPPTSFCSAPESGWAPNKTDCADDNEAINPGAIERCDDPADEDCDGSADSPDWYLDADGDSFGVSAGGPVLVGSCVPPDDGEIYSTRSGDCDDAEPTTYPGAPELEACDAIDSNCDGAPEIRLTWSFDSDGDGYGSDDTAVVTCTPPTSPPLGAGFGTWVLQGGDCDDTNDGITFGRLFYQDQDGDEVGNGAAGRFFCPMVDDDGQPVSYFVADDVNWSAFPGDCYDDNPAVTLPVPYFVDVDQDTWGNQAAGAVSRCPLSNGDAPTGLVARPGDCNDLDDAINPDATEVDGDGVDSNCDGSDDANVVLTWYQDGDSDGLGDATMPSQSFLPGYVLNAVDCDDTTAAIGSSIAGYLDLDEDGIGAGDFVLIGSCDYEPGFSPVGGDCDDFDQDVFPGAVDVCDGVDDDCDGEDGSGQDVDQDGTPECEDPDDLNPNLPPRPIWYVDADQDGFGDENAEGVVSALPVIGSVQNADDCDDSSPTINPSVFIEFCNGQDDDCDGVVDISNPFTNSLVASTAEFYVFGDLDGNGLFSLNTAIGMCSPPPGFTGTVVYPQGSVDWIVPMAPEDVEDCDGRGSVVGSGVLYFPDEDGDGVGSADGPQGVLLDCNDAGPFFGMVAYDGRFDCDPTNPNRYNTTTGVEYVDEDEDGFISRVPGEANRCTGEFYGAPGIDCDDQYNDPDPTDTFRDQEVDTQSELDSALALCGPDNGLNVQMAGDLTIDGDALGLTDSYYFKGRASVGDPGSCGQVACLTLDIEGPDVDLGFEDVGLAGRLGAADNQNVYAEDVALNDLALQNIAGWMQFERAVGTVQAVLDVGDDGGFGPRGGLSFNDSDLEERPGRSFLFRVDGGNLNLNQSIVTAVDPGADVARLDSGSINANDVQWSSAGGRLVDQNGGFMQCNGCALEGGEFRVQASSDPFNSWSSVNFGDLEVGAGSTVVTGTNTNSNFNGSLNGTRPGPLVVAQGQVSLNEVTTNGQNTLVDADTVTSNLSVSGLEIGDQVGTEPMFVTAGGGSEVGSANLRQITTSRALQAPLVTATGGFFSLSRLDVQVAETSLIVSDDAGGSLFDATVDATGTRPLIDMVGAGGSTSLQEVSVTLDGVLYNAPTGSEAPFNLESSEVFQREGLGASLIQAYGRVNISNSHLSGYPSADLVVVQGAISISRSILWSETSASALNIAPSLGAGEGESWTLDRVTLRNLGPDAPTLAYNLGASLWTSRTLLHQEGYVAGPMISCPMVDPATGDFWITDLQEADRCGWSGSGVDVTTTNAPDFDGDHISTIPQIRDFYGSAAF